MYLIGNNPEEVQDLVDTALERALRRLFPRLIEALRAPEGTHSATETLQPISVDVARAAAMTGLSRSTIRRRINDGTLKTVRVGGRVLIPVKALEILVSGDPAPDSSADSSTP